MALMVFMMLFLSLTGYSTGLYCLCKDGVSDALLQKAIDYSCGAGSDCGQIIQNGACYQPNTIKDHCNYAVNSYYQKKVSQGATCDFGGAATTSSTPPSNAVSTCVYPSSSSNAGTGTSTTPSTTTGTTTPSTTTNSTSTGTTTTTPSVFGTGTTNGLGPSGSGFTDSSTAGVALFSLVHLFYTCLALWMSGVVCLF